MNVKDQNPKLSLTCHSPQEMAVDDGRVPRHLSLAFKLLGI